MSPEIIAGVIGAVAIVLSTSISYTISMRIARKQTRLGYLQTILSDETILKNFRYFWRQLNILQTYYRLFPSKANSMPDLNREDMKDDLEVVFAYLEDRLGQKMRKLKEDGRQLKSFEKHVLGLIKGGAEKEDIDRILKDRNFFKSFKLCLEDAHRYFHIRAGESWFCVMFGPAPKLQRKIIKMTKSSISWKNDLTKWDKLSQLLGKFLAGDW